MIRNTVRAAQSGLNAEHCCGKATILVASDLQAKLKDFISPITTDNGTPHSSTMKFRLRNFILMDGLSIFLERSHDEKIDVAKTCSRINRFSLPFERRESAEEKILTPIRSAIYLPATLVQQLAFVTGNISRCR